MLNFGFIKRIMLSVLSVLVGLIYHAEVHGYVTYTISQITSMGYNTDSCDAFCSSRGYSFGDMGSRLYSTQGYLNSSGLNSSYCYCFTTAEWTTIASCALTMCSTKYPGAVGHMRWTLGVSSCNGLADCVCSTGYYTSYMKCVICPVGHYCPGNVPAYANVASVGLIQCPAGWVQPYKGYSTCNPCPTGYYTATTGSSTCIMCSPGTYSAYTGSSSCSHCAYFYPGGNTTPTSVKGTSRAGADVPTLCNIASSINFDDGTGVWHFASNCYYS